MGLIFLSACHTYRVPPQESDIRIARDRRQIEHCQRLKEVRAAGPNALQVLDEVKFQTWDLKGDTLLITLENNGTKISEKGPYTVLTLVGDAYRCLR